MLLLVGIDGRTPSEKDATRYSQHRRRCQRAGKNIDGADPGEMQFAGGLVDEALAEVVRKWGNAGQSERADPHQHAGPGCCAASIAEVKFIDALKAVQKNPRADK